MLNDTEIVPYVNVSLDNVNVGNDLCRFEGDESEYA